MKSELLNGEELITLSQAASLFPGSRGAARAHPSTFVRQILNGVLGRNGQRVKLEAIRIGAKWLTSQAALQRFSAAIQAVDDGPVVRTPAERNQAAEAAVRELELSGA